MSTRSYRPSAALVVAILALVLAVGTTSYAAITIPRNSVGSKQIKPSAVQSSDIKNGGVKAVDLAAGAVPRVLYAEITPGASPAVKHGSGVTGVTWQIGSYYLLTLNRDVSGCVPFASVTGANGNNIDAGISVTHRLGDADQIHVITYQSGVSVNTVPFSVEVICPS